MLTPASACRCHFLILVLWTLSLLVIVASESTWDRRCLAHIPVAVPLLAPIGAPSIARPPSSSNKSLQHENVESKRGAIKKTKKVKKTKKLRNIPFNDSNAKLPRSTQKRKVKVRKVLAKRSFLTSQVERIGENRRVVRKESSRQRQKGEAGEPFYSVVSEGYRSRKPSPKTRPLKRMKRKSVVAAENLSDDDKSVEAPTSSTSVVDDNLQKIKRRKVKKIRKRKSDTSMVDVVTSTDDSEVIRSELNMVTSGNISSPSLSDDRDIPVPVLFSDSDEPIISSTEKVILPSVVENDVSVAVQASHIPAIDISTNPVTIQDGETSHDGVSIQPIDELSSASPKVAIDAEYVYLHENASSTSTTEMSENVMSLENELIDSSQVLSQMEITMEISSSIDVIDLNDRGRKDALESVSLHEMGLDDEGKNTTFTIQNGKNTSVTQIITGTLCGIEGTLSTVGEHGNDETDRVREEHDVANVDVLSVSSEELSQLNSTCHSEILLAEPVATLSPGVDYPATDDLRILDMAAALSVDDMKGVDGDEIDIGSESAIQYPEFDEKDDSGNDTSTKKSNVDVDELDDEDDDNDGEGFDTDVASEKGIHAASLLDSEESGTPSHQVEAGSLNESAIDSSTDADAHTAMIGVFEPSTNLSDPVFKETDKENVNISSDNIAESHFEKPDLTVSVVTWNLAEESPLPEDALFIKHFRDNGKDRENGSDLVLISGQECENIKPRRSEGSRSREFRRLMIVMLGKDYVPLAMHLLGGIQFCLFCKRSILSDIQKASVADVTCGIGNVFHNKGAIGCFLQMKAKSKSHGEGVQRKLKSVRMLFVTAHMAAHVKNTEARDSDFWRIVRELEIQAPTSFLPKRNSDTEATGDFLLESMDRIFFCGDLNYRIDLPREEVEYAVHRIRSLTESRNPKTLPDAETLRQSLLQYDQLRATIALGRAFPGFAEGPITFAPTFKFDKGTDDYDTSPKQRIPAWTDRILFKPVGTQVSIYNSVETARHSDHRPVFATFLVDMTARDLPLGNRKRKRAAVTNRKKNE
jgi:hypothetical protein